jgi:hypothetical protein
MKRACLALLVMSLAACSSMQPVSVSDLANGQAPAEIQTGDRVEVISRDGEKFEFTVTEVNAIGLGGKFGFIPYQNMRRLSVRRPGSDPEDYVWLWGILGAALFVAIIANADSVSVCSPSPCPIQ